MAFQFIYGKFGVILFANTVNIIQGYSSLYFGLVFGLVVNNQVLT